MGGTGVAVGGTGVAVGGTDVAVGGTDVAVGGTDVATGRAGVGVGVIVGVAVEGTEVAEGGTVDVALGAVLTTADEVAAGELSVVVSPPQAKMSNNANKPAKLLVSLK